MCGITYPPIVDRALFERARAIVDARSRHFTDEELLQSLRGILAQHGMLSGLLIDEREEMPSSSAYRHRFGSLLRAYELIGKVDALGGSVNAIEFITGEIDESAWGYQERYRIGQDVVVGVNKYEEDEIEVPDLLRVDPESEREQLERLAAFKANRDQELVARRLDEIRDAARGTGNMLPVIKDALRDRASMGEVSGAMQDVFGNYAPTF